MNERGDGEDNAAGHTPPGGRPVLGLLTELVRIRMVGQLRSGEQVVASTRAMPPRSSGLFVFTRRFWFVVAVFLAGAVATRAGAPVIGVVGVGLPIAAALLVWAALPLLLARKTVPARTLDLPYNAAIAVTTARVLVFALEGRRRLKPTRLVGDFLFEDFTRTEGPILITGAVPHHRSVLHRKDGSMLMWNSPGEDEMACVELVRYVAARQ